MKVKLPVIPLIFATLLSSAPAYAHHSFAAEFDGTKPTRLVGKITRVEVLKDRLFHKYARAGYP